MSVKSATIYKVSAVLSLLMAFGPAEEDAALHSSNCA